MISMGREMVGFRIEKPILEELDETVERYPKCTGESELVRNIVKVFLQYESGSDSKGVEYE